MFNKIFEFSINNNFFSQERKKSDEIVYFQDKDTNFLKNS